MRIGSVLLGSPAVVLAFSLAADPRLTTIRTALVPPCGGDRYEYDLEGERDETDVQSLHKVKAWGYPGRVGVGTWHSLAHNLGGAPLSSS